MMFNERIKQLSEDCQIPQRKLAAALDIDTASYCKIERGERRARKEHIPIIAELLQTDENEKEVENPNRLYLNMNRMNILDWFREKYQEVQRKVVSLPKNCKTLKL